MSLLDRLEEIRRQGEQAFAEAETMAELEEKETLFLGRKGQLSLCLRELAEASAAERPLVGAKGNEVKRFLEASLQAGQTRLEGQAMVLRLERERVDVTEPGVRPPRGHLHLVTQAIQEITDIFARAGFVRVRYPEVEWDWYAFESLNMPKDHPARDEWETFFVDAPGSERWGKLVLTPHTTSGTARALTEKQFPLRVINIAKTYRRQMDVTHTPMFHQFDGVFVDKGVAITHLRGILEYFAHAFFGPERKTRLRPFHFRFTEPSFEIDISCGVCGGSGHLNKDGRTEKCRTCKRGWLELGGAGMLHPNVLTAAGIDPRVYSGLAFGWGVERTYMMKEGVQVDDIRLLYKNDLRFLQQF